MYTYIMRLCITMLSPEEKRSETYTFAEFVKQIQWHREHNTYCIIAHLRHHYSLFLHAAVYCCNSYFPVSTLSLVCSIARYKSLAARELGSTPNTSISFGTASLVRSNSCLRSECSDDLDKEDESAFVVVEATD